MKAIELRIGNLFIEKYTKEIIKVIELRERRITYSGVFIGEWQAEPIPLTKEWLLKFGFEKSDFYKNFRVKAGDYYNSVQYIDKTWFYSNDSSDAGCYVVADFKYVHQLQNLYFALTGDELTFKSK